jgi:K+-transporting ATPase ATPase C chain
MNMQKITDATIRHIGPAVMYTIVSVILLGIVYPLAMTGLAELIFPTQASGSIVYRNGHAVGSDIIGQLWTKPEYFHGRPSAAGSGYDPTSTSGTNLGPTSKKLIDATAATIKALKKDNPDAAGLVPMDLVTSSGSGIDPDISPGAAYYQAPRVAKARQMNVNAVRAVVAAHILPRELGFLGEPRVNVMQLNLSLDGQK